MSDKPKNDPIVMGPELIPVYANDYLVTFFTDMFRLTFAETVYGAPETNPRVAVVMEPKRAILLAKAILNTYRGLAATDPALLALINDGN